MQYSEKVQQDTAREKVLITGASGYLGSFLFEYFSRTIGKSYGTWITNPVNSNNTFKLNLLNPDEVSGLIQRLAPIIIIHTAGLTDVDGCERNPRSAFESNVQTTKNVVEAAKSIGAKVVYISSEAVYKGAKKSPYSETDDTVPVNEYGRTKLMGEQIVKDSTVPYLITRVARIVGGSPAQPLSRFDQAIRALQQGSETQADSERIFTPTGNQHLAEVINWWIQNGNPSAVLNVAAHDAITYMEFLQRVASELQYLGKVTEKPLGTYFAPRPKYVTLDTRRLVAMGAPVTTVREVIDKTVGQIKKTYGN